jgi:hypothetical protein
MAAPGARGEVGAERAGVEQAHRRDRCGVVALSSHGKLPADGNSWVGERDARRQEARGGKAERARPPETHRRRCTGPRGDGILSNCAPRSGRGPGQIPGPGGALGGAIESAIGGAIAGGIAGGPSGAAWGGAAGAISGAVGGYIDSSFGGKVGTVVGGFVGGVLGEGLDPSGNLDDRDMDDTPWLKKMPPDEPAPGRGPKRQPPEFRRPPDCP